jgi:hypothetical protein
VREGGEDQLSDELVGLVVGKVRPHRTDGHGAPWRVLEGQTEKIRAWIDDEDLTVAKVHDLLTRQEVVVPLRTLERFCAELCGPRRGRGTTVRVADGEPGDELQVDFGRMGLLFDSVTKRRRVCHALIFTPCGGAQESLHLARIYAGCLGPAEAVRDQLRQQARSAFFAGHSAAIAQLTSMDAVRF